MITKLLNKFFPLFFGLTIFANIAFAQDNTKGTVTDADGKPLPDITVKVKGTKNATATNSNGNFSIAAPKTAVLVFTAVGFVPQEVNISGTGNISVKLIASNKALDEVIVVGYGTQKKRDLTGAVSSVKTKDLVLSSSPEIGSMLKGKVAGLTVIQNSAQPGGGLDILIRGNGNPDNNAASGFISARNLPLYVVDGFPIDEIQQPGSGGRYDAGSQSPLNLFNPNDIESIEVLKDASSTAIYGARAANGVILITTKKGAEGAPKVSYSSNYSIQKYKNPFDALPLNEWMDVRNKAGQEQWEFNNNVFPYGTKTRAEAEANPVNGFLYKNLYTQNAINNVGKGTDWFKLVTRDGSTQQHNLSISGGNKFTRYFVSGNYFDQKGIVKNSDFKRYALRVNIDQDINKYFKTGFNITASRVDNNNTQLGGDQFENSGIIRAAIQQGPHIEAIDDNGDYPLNPQLGLQPNPASLLTITDKGRLERILANTFVDFIPIKNLTLKLKVGMDRTTANRGSYLPKSTLFGALEKGRAFLSNTNNDNYLIEGTVNYTKLFRAVHKIDVLVGASKQTTTNRFSSAGSTGYITDAFLWNNLGAGAVQLPSSSEASKNVFESVFGRLNYNYKSKYYATFSIRTDGSSVFAKNNKFGTFPSAAVAWNVAEEPFFNQFNKVVSQLKIRYGYGQAGNASILGTNAFAAYSAFPGWVGPSDLILPAVALSRLANDDLKWQTNTGSNFGIDFGLFNGKIEGTVEIFNNVISDLLATKNLNLIQPVNTVIYNVGKTQSKGIEVSLSSRNIQTKNFQWRTTFNYSTHKDTWKEREPNWLPAVYESENDPIRARYSTIADGILQIGEKKPAAQPLLIPGQIKIKDLDGYQRDGAGNPVADANGRFIRTGVPDGKIDEADTRLLGTRDPKFMLGFTNIINYKNFSLNFDFTGLFGRKIVDPNYFSYGIGAVGLYEQGYNALRTVKDRWTPTNASTTHPSSFWGYSPYGVGDFFEEDAWFLRLQNVSLGYNIPTRLVKNVFSNIRVHADAQNLFVITPYKGVDPETDSYTAAYPYIRTFTFGLNFTF